VATEIILPKFGFTHEQSQIARWLKHAGDRVEKGEPIVEVTTDKINMEVESPADGILAGLRAKEGDILATTEVLAYVVQPGETPPDVPRPQAAPSRPQMAPAAPIPPPASKMTPVAARLAGKRGLDLNQVSGSGPGGRITRRDVEALQTVPTGRVAATPAARRLAHERGIALAGLSGSGPLGRIQAADVPIQAGQESKPPASQILPLVGMRATIAERMSFSARTAPHFSLQVDVDATQMEALRHRLNEQGPERISPTAVLVKAVASTLAHHPEVNASLEGDAIRLHAGIHLGVAVALPDGLVVPVIHAVEEKTILTIARELRQVTDRARLGRLAQSDLTGGTFTISNLGMYGIDRFTAIINPPESAILAVGRLARRAVPAAESGDEIVVRTMCTLTLSVDHRVLDGAMAARFLDDLCGLLEDPVTLEIPPG
jgi:pyruvate dehydrogenase E2 component (dihydrolipoyllysine-residue acetyltransferase)